MDLDDDENYNDDSLCPLCLEELDLTDKNFRPCTCGYQVIYFILAHFARCAGFVGTI